MGKFNEFFKENKKLMVLLSIVSVLLLVGIVFFVSVFLNRYNEGDSDETVAAQELLESPTVSPSPIDLLEELEDLEIDDIALDGLIDEEDAHDPQIQGTTGVEVDIKEMTPKNNHKKILLKGIDVAKWQGVIDWKKVKDADIAFAMIRVGYRTLDNGIIVEDPYAKYNLQEAEKYDIKIGVYFFSTAVDEEEAIEEAQWVADFIAAYSISYPVAYNCEGFNDPNNRQYGMSKELRTNGAIAFLNKIKEEGYTPMFYASKNELENDSQWITSRLSQMYKIWLAHYPYELNEGMQSDYSGDHDMWQFTSKGIVSGIDRPVDLNLAYFDVDTIAKPQDDTKKEEVSADPAAIINFKEVNELVTAKDKTNLRSLPSSDDSGTIVAVLKNQDTAVRTGIADNGWSRVEYNGKTLYGVTSYLTKDLDYQPPTTKPEEPTELEVFYKDIREEVTAKEKTNLRSEASSVSEKTIVHTLNYGDIAIRIGLADNGWSKVEYDGQILYGISNFLTTDMNYQDNVKIDIEDPESSTNFTEVNEKVTAKEVTNLRLIPSTEGESMVEETLHNGEIALRTGIGDNGWSRLEYNDKTLYAVTNYLEIIE